MTHFLFDLVSNLALLVIVQIACCLYNRFASGPAINGTDVFAALLLFAFLFDAALTFVIFADAQSRYGQYSSSDAFVERACAYGLAIIVALRCAPFASGASQRRQTGCDPDIAVF